MDRGEFAALALRRLARKLTVRALGLVVVVGVIAVVGISTSLVLLPKALPERCLPARGDLPIDAAGPSGLTVEQRMNAAAIVAAGRARGVPDRGLWIALATALQESGLRNLGYGDRDSLGLFQQRPSMGWGTPDQVQNPRYAADRFFGSLMAIPDWTGMELWEAAQAVQRSAFPMAYAKWEQTAADLLSEVGAGAMSPTAPVGVPLTNGDLGCDDRPAADVPAAPGGPRARPPGCTQDDPTTRGCVTATTRFALDQIAGAFGELRRGRIIESTSCFAARPANPTSDHPLGKGCDIFPGPGGRFAAGRDVDEGWMIAEWFRTNSNVLDVSYVIWQGQIWTASDSGSGWADYSGGGVYDPTDAVGGHYDHIHVSFQR